MRSWGRNRLGGDINVALDGGRFDVPRIGFGRHLLNFLENWKHYVRFGNCSVLSALMNVPIPRSSPYEMTGRLLSSEGPKWSYMHNNVANLKIMMNPMANRAYFEWCQ